jgi:hypothetical protein
MACPRFLHGLALYRTTSGARRPARHAAAGLAAAFPQRLAPWTVSNFAALADGALAVLGADVNLSARRARRFGGVAPAASSFGLRVEYPAI